MSEPPEFPNSDFYRELLAQNDFKNAFKTADIQRKCAVLSFDAACKR